VTRSVLWMQAGVGDPALEYAAIDDRLVTLSLWATEGVVSTGLKVTQRAAGANFSVDVATGIAVITGDDVTGQGTYLIYSDAVENVTIPAPPGAGSRTHRVIAQVRDKLHNSTDWSTYEWTIDVLEDTGSGTPTLTDSAISLALVTVAAGQTSVTDADIQDFRPNALSRPGRPRLVADAASRPVRPVEAEEIWRQDLKDVEVYDGSAWWLAGVTRPAARLGRTSSNQSIPDSTTTALQFNTEFEDTHNGHDNSANNSRYTAPIDGLYLVTATVTWAQNSSGIREIGLRVNGSTVYDGARVVNASNITHVQSVNHLIRLNAGQYVEATVWQSTGGPLAVDRTYHSGPLMDVCWMRP
jgi:hypothetical protein